MKFIYLTWFVFVANMTFSQIPDSTLAIVFENYQPEQILKLLATSENQSERIADYRYELGFKIPSLNPISSQKINAKFGYRIHPITGQMKKHQGVDIDALRSQPVFAAADGEILEIGYHKYLGNYVKIKHLLHYETIYGHLEAYHVEPNTNVYQGQTIGTCGSSGRTTGVHLHFSILWHHQFLNPYPFIF